MDIKQLIQVLARPWLIESNQEQIWRNAAKAFLQSGTVPVFDKRADYTGGDYLSTYRLDYDGKLNNTSGPIQVMLVNGPISKYDFCGNAGSQTLTQLLNAANADASVSCGLLLIDSPGGSVDGTENLANAVKNSKKPVVTFVDGMMCSAAYWIGSAAQHIVSDGSNNGYNATIGSIGTMATYYDYSKALEKEGIAEHRVFADKSGDKWGDYFKVINGDYSDLKTILNGLNESFLSAVQTNRSGKLKLNVENVLSGKVYTATQALEFGLIDEIGDFMTAVGKAAELGQAYNKKHKSNNNTMSGKNLVFQNVLKAVAATEIAVVEGGFMLTEAQLDALDTVVGNANATAVALKSVAAEVETLRAGAADAAQVETVRQELTTAQAALTTANARIKELEAESEEYATAAKMHFGQNKRDKDPKAAHEGSTDAQKMMDNLPHNRKVDSLLGGTSTAATAKETTSEEDEEEYD